MALSLSLASTAFALNAPVLPARPSITMTASVESPAEEVAPPPFDPVAFAKTLPGITDPLGFFDPAGFCSQEGVTEGKVSTLSSRTLPTLSSCTLPFPVIAHL